MNTSILAWHYTTGVHFANIVQSGWLYPASAGVEPPEKAILWFSLDQQFEPTARMARIENGAIRTLSVQETFDLGRGLIRFGIKPNRLLAGEKLRTRARVDRKMWSDLRSSGIKQKADPDFWLGSISSMEIQQFTVDVMDSNGIWKRMQGLAADDMKGGNSEPPFGS